MTAPAHSELDESKDPKKLVPGNAEHLHHNATVFQTESDKCDTIATSLKAVRVPSWSGPSADGFEHRMSFEPTLWIKLADQFSKASKALTSHGRSITAAQSKAAEAIAKWEAGERATKTAVTEYNTRVDAYNSSCRVPTPGGTPTMGPARPGPFADPGQAQRDEAERILKEARSALDKSGTSAMAALGAMPGAKSSGSTSGPSSSGSAEGPKFTWGADGQEFGKDPTKGKNGKYDNGMPDGGPFSLSLGKLAGEASVWKAEGSVEDYWGSAKVHAKGDFTVLGAEGDASMKLDGNGLNINAKGEAYFAKTTGEAGGEWGYAEGKVGGEALVGATADGSVVFDKTSAHAGGELFAGAKASATAEGDVGGAGGSATVEGWAGVGIAGDADVGYHDGKFTIGGSGGAALGFGGKLKGEITIDVPEVVDSLSDAAGAIGGLFH